ncbi:hypothetical protein M3610_00525 [Neobacillus sp. MER 74]|uniref:hypothetical protein n=1 Tax=Neobacillus sp. MER 74 TaxID=2939566 RepID=UPI00203C2D9C|nr:hypothetical protein [Neobacillus sp. MER 74]MCM3113776.1 hypothetical protein [Neobacillus sp. MER 74]
MMMYGVNSFNQLEVLSFTHSNQAALDQWIKVFQEHGVKIYHTEKALTATPNTPEGIEVVPMMEFEGTLKFVVGSEAEDLDNIFLTEEQENWAADQETKRRKQGFIFTVFLAILQTLMICFWFPKWNIDGESFADDSGVIFAFLFTVFIQFFIYWYMHKVKWYEPIRDMAILYIGIILGRALSPDDWTNFHHAVEEYAVMVIGCFLFFYYRYKR